MSLHHSWQRKNKQFKIYCKGRSTSSFEPASRVVQRIMTGFVLLFFVLHAFWCSNSTGCSLVLTQVQHYYTYFCSLSPVYLLLRHCPLSTKRNCFTSFLSEWRPEICMTECSLPFKAFTGLLSSLSVFRQKCS